jgi:hypothetical protein
MNRTIPPDMMLSLITARPVASIGDENAGCAPASSSGKERAMPKRRRFSKQQTTLQDRIIERIKEVRDQAAALPPGPESDMLLKKARQAETALHLEDWVNSPGLQPPK